MAALTRDGATRARTISGITIFLGLWLVVSPWVFAYGGRSAVLNSALVGALIAMLAAIRLTTLQYSLGMSRVSLLLGFWTIVSPWAMGYAANKPAMANDMMVGVFVMALALWSTRATEPKPRRGMAGH